LQSEKVYYLQKNPNQLLDMLGKLFVFSFIWSIGGMFKLQEDADDYDMIRRGQDKGERDANICNECDNFMHELFEVEPPLGIRLPTGNKVIYAYFIDMESGNFVSWDVLVPNTKSLIEKGAVITIGETMGVSGGHKKKREEAEITPTVDHIQFSFLSGLLLLHKHPVLLTGESGVGKSSIINHMLGRLGQDGATSTKSGTVLGQILSYSDKTNTLLESISKLTEMDNNDESKCINVLLGTAKPKSSAGVIIFVFQFSAQMTAARLKAHIMHKLIKKGKDTLGAPRGKKVLVFVDDLNMPAPEVYGAQPPLELLRQFLELGGFYHAGKAHLVWEDIYDVHVVAACGPPGGGRNPIHPRLLKHF
ncbi:dynein axonemal heavy chain 14-like, partial [Saccostrea cucullata]|uniref:dynein axonemal heavy chain 14-like n=1 Tax=Saccostrea cuccullata TaxID=36930 RepID=UPI002ED46D66